MRRQRALCALFLLERFRRNSAATKFPSAFRNRRASRDCRNAQSFGRWRKRPSWNVGAWRYARAAFYVCVFCARRRRRSFRHALRLLVFLLIKIVNKIINKIVKSGAAFAAFWPCILLKESRNIDFWVKICSVGKIAMRRRRARSAGGDNLTFYRK